ncbi:helix-turn-helix transcriptional regulator [Paraburkholderia caledonica]|jgi:PAS domain S-box-containing protein|uniref:helix-turn-helix transcriptional regulator n=1 Tax=Paraburkholderia caledonica TaxID=134536 RepID=UPI0038B850FE
MDASVQRPKTDRRQLQQIIAGLSEGVILIEPDQSIRWANQAALDMHGASSIEELGRNVSEYRQRFQLRYRNNHRIEPGSYPIDRVVAGESFSDVLVEVAPAGQAEPRWVHRVRSLVITDTDGEPDCLVLILHDATEWASAEERFEKTFGANPAPAVICRLSDLRFIKVNRGFVEMTGYTREQVIGRSVYELDVLENASQKELAVERLTAGQTIPQMEALLRLADSESKLVIVAGQPIDLADEGCMLFTFMDLEPRRKAEQALRRSEEQFANAFRMAPIPTIVYARDSLTLLEANQAFLDATGFAAEELVGHTLEESTFWDAEDAHAKIEQMLATSGNLRNVEFKVRTRAGLAVDCLISAESVPIHGDDCVLMVFQDITERKRTEVELLLAIEAVMQDASWFSRSILDKLRHIRSGTAPGKIDAAISDLTPRERDVLALICEGLADKEIATRLGVAPNTVRSRVSTLYAKLGLHSRSEAIIWAREHGLPAGGVASTRPAARASRRSS